MTQDLLNVIEIKTPLGSLQTVTPRPMHGGLYLLFLEKKNMFLWYTVLCGYSTTSYISLHPASSSRSRWSSLEKKDSTQKEFTIYRKNQTQTVRMTKSDNRGGGAPLIQLKLTPELIFCQEACSFHLNGCRTLQGYFSCGSITFATCNVARFASMCSLKQLHSCTHVPDTITAQLPLCRPSLKSNWSKMHLMQRNEGPVLGKDEVVVPPPVVATVPQLDHMQHALTHLASYLVLVLHPLDVKCQDKNSEVIGNTLGPFSGEIRWI